MRTKKPSLIITFASTAAAMDAEAFCKENHIPGRMIPVPGEISAGCGLAFLSEPVLKEEIQQKLRASGVTVQGAYIIDF